MKGPVILAMISLGLVACSEKKANIPQSPLLKAEELDASHFTKREKSNAYGSFSVSVIKDNYLKMAEETAKSLSLESLHTDSFGFQTYLIKNHPVPGTVLILPKILAKNNFGNEKPSLERLPNGKTRLFFDVAFIDGLEGAAGYGLNGYPLRGDYKIENKVDYLKFIQSKTGFQPKVSSINSCPDTLNISFQDKSPLVLTAQSDVQACPMNTFVHYEITLMDEEYADFIKVLSRGDKAQISASINFSSGIITAYHDYKINLGPLKKQLNEKVTGSAEALTELSVDKLLEKLFSDLDIGFSESAFSTKTLIREIKNSLFDRNFSCGGDSECLKLKSSSFDGVVLPIKQNEAIPSKGQLSVNSSAELQDAISETSPIVIESQVKDLFNPPAGFLINNSMRSVMEGDVIELKVNRFLVKGFNLDEPKVTYVPNSVCTNPYSSCLAGSWTCTNTDIYHFNFRSVCGGYYQRCTHTRHVCVAFSVSEAGHGHTICDRYEDPCDAWVQDCNAWTQISDQKPMCQVLAAPHDVLVPFRMASYPSDPNFRFDCNQKTDASCDASDFQNQWQSITNYALPVNVGKWNENDLKTLDTDKLIDGIQFQFSNGVNCNLREFNPEVLSQGVLLFHVLNTPNCKIFDEKSRMPLNYPGFSILSRFSQKMDYRCGQRSESFDRSIRYTCTDQMGTTSTLDSSVLDEARVLDQGKRAGIWKSYYPPVRLEAEMHFVGNNIESNSEVGAVK